ncbi:MAG: hypothetical protein EBS31_00465 [Burkholderiaceae bacterium]|nr:hypothetical protein [Burkholderiaceae bacterium]
MSEATPFRNKAEILAELWMDYRDDDGFKDFIEYNDLGLPIAYAVANGIVESNKLVEQFIDESFRLLLTGLGIEEDLGFETLTDVLSLPKAE